MKKLRVLWAETFAGDLAEYAILVALLALAVVLSAKTLGF